MSDDTIRRSQREALVDAPLALVSQDVRHRAVRADGLRDLARSERSYRRTHALTSSAIMPAPR